MPVLTPPTTDGGRAALEAIVDSPETCLAMFDYDGTIAPIVPDPSRAAPCRQVVDGLEVLSSYGVAVAVVTGRPARIAVELGGFAGRAGLRDLVVVGHYGLERWDAGTGEVTTSEAPPGLESAKTDLPSVLREAGVTDADVEDKGLSVAVHVRRSARPQESYRAMEQPLARLAEVHGLVAEPGRLVVELRPPGMDKGHAVSALLRERRARSCLYVGDDLGDLAAYGELERARAAGTPALLVCAGSSEVGALAARADVVVDGPEGLARFLEGLVAVLAGDVDLPDAEHHD